MNLPDKIYFESASGGKEFDLTAVHAEQGNIFLNGDITTNTALRFASIMKYLQSKGKEVTIYLNSPGGEVTAGLMIYDIIRSYPYELKIVCTGLAASMGAIILAGGRKGKRFILPHSKVMIHEPLISNGFGGSATTIKQNAQIILDVKRCLNEILANHTGKSLEEIDKATAFDNYMTAEEAVDFGICDAIGNIY